MNCRFLKSVVAVLLFFAVSTTLESDAEAAPITMNYNVTASGFTKTFGGVGVPPYDPVFLNFDLTFDPALSVANSSTGLVLNSFTLPLALNSYSYGPGSVLSVSSGVTGINSFGWSTQPNFGIFINSPLAASSGGFFRYATAAGNDFDWSDSSITVRTQVVRDRVPEPSTTALIAMALLSLLGFGVMRRRAEA